MHRDIAAHWQATAWSNVLLRLLLKTGRAHVRHLTAHLCGAKAASTSQAHAMAVSERRRMSDAAFSFAPCTTKLVQMVRRTPNS